MLPPTPPTITRVLMHVFSGNYYIKTSINYTVIKDPNMMNN